MKVNVIHNEDCLAGMGRLPDDSVDLVVTDPPYGIFMMSKNWDRAIPSIEIWKECLRVLKPGAFAFVMCIPRQDCLARMIVGLEDAGFRVNFSPIVWAFGSGFPKAQNIGRTISKRQGAKRQGAGTRGNTFPLESEYREYQLSPQAKALDGSYGGFQPKPAVEVILVAMKPMSEKTFVDQAMKNGKGITWLDDGRIPYHNDNEKNKCMGLTPQRQHTKAQTYIGGAQVGDEQLMFNRHGRFPANLLCSDDVLNDGKNRESGWRNEHKPKSLNNIVVDFGHPEDTGDHYPDSGSFSRYFSVDAWWTKKLSELDKLYSKAYNKDKNNGAMLWEASQAEEDLGFKKDGLSALNAKKNSPIMKAIGQENINSVQPDVTPDSDSQGQNQDAKSATEKSDCTETDIAQSLVQIKHDTETLLATLESESTTPIMRKEQTLFSQSVVNYVVGKLKDLKDIIQISINQPRLFGYVIPVIIKQMRQDLSQDQLWQNFWQERIKTLPKSQQQTFPFAVISKASKGEKNKGCQKIKAKEKEVHMKSGDPIKGLKPIMKNIHPTCKPVKLMSFLITLGSRQGDVVLDPFVGSGTTAVAAKLLDRNYIAFEIDPEYTRIAKARIAATHTQLTLFGEDSP